MGRRKREYLKLLLPSVPNCREAAPPKINSVAPGSRLSFNKPLLISTTITNSVRGQLSLQFSHSAIEELLDNKP